MKYELNIETIALVAVVLELIHLWPQFKKIRDTGDVSSFDRRAIELGIIAGILWLSYGILKKIHFNAFTSFVILLFNLYIYNKIIEYEREKNRA